jgi:hypothetical protein
MIRKCSGSGGFTAANAMHGMGVRYFSVAHQQNFACVCLLLVHLKIKMHQQT